MKSTKKTCSMLLATALLLTTLSPLSAFGEDGAANPSQPTSTAVEAIHDTTVRTPESTINALINQYNTTSLQYALIDQGQITKSGHGGVYSKSENKALTEETLYGIGSISKLFTTTAVMKLVDLGKIQLDAPVTTYIPEFKMADERYQDITVRMLLNHSSGFMGSTMNNAFLFNDPDQGVTENLLVNLQEQRLKATPGAFSVYCNDGFTLAELVVERVSGQSFTTFLHETITTPLNLKNTKTPEDDFQREQL
ncbi:MAG: serine hydrolase domain-containing protein, partial [Anaerovorax sp.]